MHHIWQESGSDSAGERRRHQGQEVFNSVHASRREPLNPSKKSTTGRRRRERSNGSDDSEGDFEDQRCAEPRGRKTHHHQRKDRGERQHRGVSQDALRDAFEASDQADQRPPSKTSFPGRHGEKKKSAAKKKHKSREAPAKRYTEVTAYELRVDPKGKPARAVAANNEHLPPAGLCINVCAACMLRPHCHNSLCASPPLTQSCACPDKVPVFEHGGKEVGASKPRENKGGGGACEISIPLLCKLIAKRLNVSESRITLHQASAPFGVRGNANSFGEYLMLHSW